MPWWLREVPGFFAVGAYLMLVPIIALSLFRFTRRTMPYRRWFLLLLFIQLTAAVPIKIVTYWVFSMKYFIHVPEHSFNV